MAVVLQALLALVVVLVIAALVFGVVSVLSGDDPGLSPADPDTRAVPLPNDRSLTEADLKTVRFDVALRGYRMAQVDRVLRRTAYDLGYKDEMIAVLEAEVIALRDGRIEDAELLRKARESATGGTSPSAGGTATPRPDEDRHPVASSGRSSSPSPERDDVDHTDTDHTDVDHTDTDQRDTDQRDTDQRDTDQRDTDTKHQETEERREEDPRSPLTQEPTREPTGDATIDEERASP